jgi:uncharacterized protein (DUF2267 family)
MSIKDACAWLKKMGWMLTSEPYLKNKLAEILFSVALSFKLPPNADTAIRSVAYVVHDQAEEETVSSLSEELIKQDCQ